MFNTMPNECVNSLTAIGPLDQLLVFFMRACGKPDNMVESLVQGALGASESAPDLRRQLLEQVVVDGFSFQGHVPEPPDNEVEATTPPDAVNDPNWWRNEHWSTKWDARDPELVEAPSPDQLRVRFFTAWAPPEEWLKCVAAAHPSLRFELAFAEPGIGGLGVLIAGPNGAWIEDDWVRDSDPPSRFERYLGWDPTEWFT
jgi:Ferredoxin-like domain in Api92-like protein